MTKMIDPEKQAEKDYRDAVKLFWIVLAILFGLALGTLLVPRAHAQNTFANTTVSVPVLTSFAGVGTFGCPSSGTGGGQCQGITSGVFPNIGQGAHFLHYCTTATTLQLGLEESPDGVNYAFITPIYGPPPFGAPCGLIQAGGYFQTVRGHILAQSGGSTSVWYSASAGPISVFPTGVNSNGAFSPVQCDKTVLLSVAPSTTSLLITGTNDQRIFICGGTYSFSAATTTGQISLQYGTGSTCSTVGPVAFWINLVTASTPQTEAIFSLSAGAPIVPVANNFCVTTTGITATTEVAIAYAQL